MSCQISVWCEVLILVTEPDLCSIFFSNQIDWILESCWKCSFAVAF